MTKAFTWLESVSQAKMVSDPKLAGLGWPTQLHPRGGRPQGPGLPPHTCCLSLPPDTSVLATCVELQPLLDLPLSRSCQRLLSSRAPVSGPMSALPRSHCQAGPMLPSSQRQGGDVGMP